MLIVKLLNVCVIAFYYFAKKLTLSAFLIIKNTKILKRVNQNKGISNLDIRIFDYGNPIYELDTSAIIEYNGRKNKGTTKYYQTKQKGEEKNEII